MLAALLALGKHEFHIIRDCQGVRMVRDYSRISLYFTDEDIESLSG